MSKKFSTANYGCSILYGKHCADRGSPMVSQPNVRSTITLTGAGMEEATDIF